MKRKGILNSDISRVLSYMGHTDQICIGDCGLPVPDTTERIDLTVSFGVPSFMEVLKEVSQDMKIEKVILAEEIKKQNPKQLKEVLKLIKSLENGKDIKVVYVSHSKLKELTHTSKAVIRTGETTPYSNIILQSGCIFG